MIDDDLRKQILKSISLSGSATEENATVKPIINGNIKSVLDTSSGSVRIQNNVIRKFELIIGQPKSIEALHHSQIRCCLCRKVIGYPAWYYRIEYAVNHFHYFICFDSASALKPTTKCYKR